jgi:hypothetical protein
MERRSAMMAGSRMTIDLDAHGGRAVGSKVRIRGKMLGMELALEEVVTEREPPRRKAWQTMAADLLVIGPYRLGFDLESADSATRARIFIDYDLPPKRRWLGRLFARRYARWCTQRMAADAAAHFNV